MDRGRTIGWYAACAAFAAAVACFSDQPVQRSWGTWAAGGYLAATASATLWRSYGRQAAVVLALTGALGGPLLWRATGGRDLPRVGEGALTVVSRAGELLLHHGTPYLDGTRLYDPESYNPYGSALAVFGLPHALGLPGWAGNPRLWFGASGVLLLWAAFRRAGVSDALGCTAIAFAAPLLAQPLTLGGTDIPVMALLFLSLALLIVPSRVVLAGLALGVACAMKATAWPAVPVLVAMLLVRNGIRPALRFTVAVAVTAAGSFVATAPAALAAPSDLFRNTVLFPLGLTQRKTTAASSLPGHLLAGTGSAGHWVSIGLLAAAIVGTCILVVLRPPAGLAAAVRYLAGIYAVIFTLAPATRWGYFAYPLGLLGWYALTTWDRTGPAVARGVPVQPAAPAVESTAAYQSART
ncbi:hypothetical protein [Planosporangium mesophilum]|uniref:DUF2029 domain-containing protein n=1 Tax=Planosporangium mesophilum TaxID=689768 RepID=A0A8J3TCG0_9ACTN|nr:hypothetical protein [Planosporangium mesophilum]NJC84599.1 hypothetical protein [Planosporangium mesophilum]GII23908.1 hypothetical protein Pme01_35050 [Planosporangium mesophilum]